LLAPSATIINRDGRAYAFILEQLRRDDFSRLTAYAADSGAKFIHCSWSWRGGSASITSGSATVERVTLRRGPTMLGRAPPVSD